MNREELKKRVQLEDEEIEKLEQIEAVLPLMADLAGADLFIDCMQVSDGKMFVAAQAGPGHMPSAYAGSVVGCYAEREDEPAIYRAMETRAPVRDIKAVTQEERSVRQDVVPITGDSGRLIGVLIGERDVSRDLRREQKYEALARRVENMEPIHGRVENMEPVHGTAEEAARHEVHHRVKNQLQLMASIMNIQVSRTKNEELRQAYRENIGRILNIASLNEFLTYRESGPVPLKPFLEKLRENLAKLYDTQPSVTLEREGDELVSGQEKATDIALELEGDELMIGQEKATDIALVINELVSNAYKHAFTGRSKGRIDVILKKGERYSTITVQDDGAGFDYSREGGNGFGMSLIRMIVRDKLQGKLYLTSDQGGTSVTFDFRV